jgi:hypothetical protein
MAVKSFPYLVNHVIHKAEELATANGYSGQDELVRAVNVGAQYKDPFIIATVLKTLVTAEVLKGTWRGNKVAFVKGRVNQTSSQPQSSTSTACLAPPRQRNRARQDRFAACRSRR